MNHIHKTYAYIYIYIYISYFMFMLTSYIGEINRGEYYVCLEMGTPLHQAFNAKTGSYIVKSWAGLVEFLLWLSLVYYSLQIPIEMLCIQNGAGFLKQCRVLPLVACLRVSACSFSSLTPLQTVFSSYVLIEASSLTSVVWLQRCIL